MSTAEKHPEVTDAEFEVVSDPPEPRPTAVDYALAAVLVGGGGLLKIGLMVAAVLPFIWAASWVGGALDISAKWAFVLIFVVLAGGIVAMRYWRATLAVLAVAAILVILGGFGLIVPALAILAVVALTWVAVWAIRSQLRGY